MKSVCINHGIQSSIEAILACIWLYPQHDWTWWQVCVNYYPGQKKNHPRESWWEERCSTYDIMLDHEQSARRARSDPRLSATFALRWSRMIEHDITRATAFFSPQISRMVLFLSRVAWFIRTGPITPGDSSKNGMYFPQSSCTRFQHCNQYTHENMILSWTFMSKAKAETKTFEFFASVAFTTEVDHHATLKWVSNFKSFQEKVNHCFMQSIPSLFLCDCGWFPAFLLVSWDWLGVTSPPPKTTIPHIEAGFKWMWTIMTTPNKMVLAVVDLCAGLVVLLPRQTRHFQGEFFSLAVQDWSLQLRGCLPVRHLRRLQTTENRRYLHQSFLPRTSSLQCQTSPSKHW